MAQSVKFSRIELNTREDVSERDLKELQGYFSAMPLEDLLLGLRFAHRRWKAKKDGLLMVGRKSKIKREVHLLTAEQARWRLKNWKMMIKSYRERGYSYPTISRIKKILQKTAKS